MPTVEYAYKIFKLHCEMNILILIFWEGSTDCLLNIRIQSNSSSLTYNLNQLCPFIRKRESIILSLNNMHNLSLFYKEIYKEKYTLESNELERRSRWFCCFNLNLTKVNIDFSAKALLKLCSERLKKYV